ncbi:MAG: uroporphyrinogen-III synthase [Bacteroidota bacterium]|nr:uroporphyrinogen-III synthase [Bacteroidota bacterium]
MPTKTTTIAKNVEIKLKKVSTILVSQPKPERSPYYEIETKFGIHIDWRPFVLVEGFTEKEFRKQRIRLEEYPCVVFTSKNAIDQFFRLAEEMRCKISEMTKYFCTSDNVANYLQKFIIFRKRKVFHGAKNISDLASYFNKHRDVGTFLVPCSNFGAPEVIQFLKDSKIKFQEAMMYRTVSADLSDLKDIKYDVLVFFSQLEIKSLFDNFPDFIQAETRIAAFGNSTAKAVSEAKLNLNIIAPSPQTPSMTMALEEYLKKSNK